MKLKDLHSLKYFLGFALILISFFVYSGVVGWKWVGGEKTEKEKPATQPHGTTYRYYRHK